jgi:hypothetical protein
MIKEMELRFIVCPPVRLTDADFAIPLLAALSQIKREKLFPFRDLSLIKAAGGTPHSNVRQAWRAACPSGKPFL